MTDITKQLADALRALLAKNKRFSGGTWDKARQALAAYEAQAELVAALRGLIDALDAKDIERAQFAMGRARVVLAGIGANGGGNCNGN